MTTRETYGVGQDDSRTDDRRWVVVDHSSACVVEDNLTEQQADELADCLNNGTKPGQPTHA